MNRIRFAIPAKAISYAALIGLLFALQGQATELSKDILQTQQKVEQMEKLESTPGNKQLKEVWQQILSTQQEQAGYLEKTKTLNQLLKDHAERGNELRRALDESNATQPAASFTGKTLPELERMQEVSATEKITLQNQLDETLNRLTQYQARLVPAQSELAEAKKSLELASKEGKVSAAVEPSLANALLLKKRVSNEARIAQIQSLDLELLSIPNQMELASLKKTMLTQKLKNLNQYQEKLQLRLQELRQAESASFLDESLQLRNTTNEDPALKWLADENVSLGNQLTAYADSSQFLADRRAAIEQQTKLIEQRHAMLKQQLDLGGDSGGTGELMRQTLMQLESLGEENTPKTIADIQKAQIQSLVYERQINELTDKAAFVQTTVARFDNSQLSIVNTDMRERLTSLLELRMNLLVKLLDRNQQTLKNWSLLLNAQNQFNDQIHLFDKLLKENLLWTPTTPPMSPAWLVEFAAGFQRVSVAWANLSQLLGSLAWPLAGIGLAYGLFRLLLHFYWRPGYLAWQKEANACVGNSRRDAFRNTLAMLAAEFAFALPMPLMLLSVKKLLGHAGEDEIWVRLLGEALRVAAIASLMSGWLWRLARPGGFLDGQLSWPAAFVKTLFRELRWRWLLVALVAYVYVSETQSNTFFRYELGRFPFLAFCVLLGLMIRTLSLAWRADLASKKLPSLKASEWPFWLGSVFVLGEIGLAGMEVFGFHLGAFVLQERLLRTLGWTVLIVLLHQIGQRWLLIEQRRMAYAHAMAVREERRAASKDKAVAEPLPETVRGEFAEIQSISLQSKTLLALLAASAFLAALAWIWADMIPAFYLLDQVVLWEIPATGSGGIGFEPVTLKAFLLALALIGLIGLAMRNLPAMFQLLVLQHLDLPPGNDFAITTLLKYGIFVGGVVVVCKLLGLQWSELQWLVAALSVGLGFGLQEIFANFISGLIILFEKPVRIGDIVTLSNGVTGTIDAINTRATMLTDWDNKEIIIPNKTLITEQLTNWSLSSPIIRVIIPVGIAYGSDTELACRLLRQAAEEHANVLTNPPIAVLFRAFGDSALNFELRCFIAEPGVSLGTVHDLNMRINQLFRENGVEIAYPQMDLHIRGGAKPAV